MFAPGYPTGLRGWTEEIDIYCDGPTADEIETLARGAVRGYTFNPTLFRSLGVVDYLSHCRTVSELCGDLPVSLEVFADDEDGMIRQAKILHGLSDNVFVKIPVTYTDGSSTLRVIETLDGLGIRLNITAVFARHQVEQILPVMSSQGAIISVFAGRLYDIGRDAATDTAEISAYVHDNSNCRVLWASPRMVYDVVSAAQANCDIITMQSALIRKLGLLGKSPEEYSLETVRMFYSDAQESGYSL